jgi:hypothetical protein
MSSRVTFCLAVLTTTCCAVHAQTDRRQRDVQIHVLLPETEGARPLTGRVFVALSRQSDDPALGMHSLGHQPIRANLGMPFFGVDVDQLRPDSQQSLTKRRRGIRSPVCRTCRQGSITPKRFSTSIQNFIARMAIQSGLTWISGKGNISIFHQVIW